MTTGVPARAQTRFGRVQAKRDLLEMAATRWYEVNVARASTGDERQEAMADLFAAARAFARAEKGIDR